MTEPKNFVARWSRLKREAEREGKAERTDSAPPSAAAETTAAGAPQATTARPETDAPASRSFDPASLPPIDSITARTDIRSFLQSGVPAELTRAVLRRAWRSDPAIRDFIGIAENQWDFTDPAAIPGFGPLRETDHLPSIVAQALGRLDKSLEASAEMGVSAQERPSATTCPGHGTVDDSVEQTRGMLAASPGNAGISASAEEKGNPDAVGKNDGAAAGNDSRRHQRGHASALPR